MSDLGRGQKAVAPGSIAAAAPTAGTSPPVVASETLTAAVAAAAAAADSRPEEPGTDGSCADGAIAPQPPDTRPKVVFVIGATGTGKTKMGVEIAQKFNGEVLNVDSLQMYKGLDVATAKVTEEEAAGVPHHLLSFLEPTEEFTVREFLAQARPIITDITSRGKLPVVVGGTMYYVQALLRDSMLEEDERLALEGRVPALRPGDFLREADAEVHGSGAAAGSAAFAASAGPAAGSAAGGVSSSLFADVVSAPPSLHSATGSGSNPAQGGNLDSAACVAASSAAVSGPDGRLSIPAPHDIPPEQLYATLEHVDPDMARKLHPNATRRILRSLEVFAKTGVNHTTLLVNQRNRLEGGTCPYLCRIFWMHADRPALFERLNRRVDRMLADGLLDEVRELWAQLGSTGKPETSTAGTASGSGPATAFDQDRDSPGSISAVTPDVAGSATSNDDHRHSAAGVFAASVSKQPRGEHESTAPSVPEKEGATGLLAAIGYKEFSDLFSRFGVDVDVESSPDARECLETCVEALKTTTRRYARQQERWIRNRFVNRGVPITTLDTTNPSQWATKVSVPAAEEVEALLRGVAPSVPLVTDADQILKWKKYVCEACGGRVLNGEEEWRVHLGTRAHQRNVGGYTKRGKRRRGDVPGSGSRPESPQAPPVSGCDNEAGSKSGKRQRCSGADGGGEGRSGGVGGGGGAGAGAGAGASTAGASTAGAGAGAGASTAGASTAGTDAGADSCGLDGGADPGTSSPDAPTVAALSTGSRGMNLPRS